MTADTTWHALGTPHGFIQAMAAENFHGSYQDAHTVADIGGDAVTGHAIDDLDWVEEKWDIPIDDILAIYKRSGISVNKNTLRYCVGRGFALSMTFKRVGMRLFTRYAKQSPFLVDNIEDYHIGGLSEMSASTSQCWQNLTSWLVDGPPANAWTICPTLSSHINQTFAGKERGHQHAKAGVMQALEEFPLAQVHSRMENGVLSLTTREDGDARTIPQDTNQIPFKFDPDPIEEQSQAAFISGPMKDQSGFGNTADCPRYPKTGLELHIGVPFAEFGHSIAQGDFSGDGSWDLAVSAPYDSETAELVHSGSVFIIPSKQLLREEVMQSIREDKIDARGLASAILRPRFEMEIVSEAADFILQSAQARFGWSLAVVDMNGDGIDDLAVSAPGHGENRGRVYVYFGRLGLGLDETPGLVIDVAESEAKHRWEHGIRGFGSTLASADVNGDGFRDLIIGSPWSDVAMKNGSMRGPPGRHRPRRRPRHLTGDVRIFLAGEEMPTGVLQHQSSLFLTHRDASNVIKAPSILDYETFGTAVDFVQDRNESRVGYLVVSAPGYSAAQEGIASESETVGRVVTYAIDKVNEKVITASPVLTLIGGLSFAKFGTSLAAGKVMNSGNRDDEMWLGIGSPSEGKNALFQSGAYRLFDLRELLRRGSKDGNSEQRVHPNMRGLITTLWGTGEVGKMGGTQARMHKGRGNGAINGALGQPAQQESVWIGEDMVNDESGRIYRWNVGAAFERALSSKTKDEEPTLAQADYCVEGMEQRAHFGSQILVVGDGGIAVSARRSSLGGRMSGKVILYL